MSTSQDELPVVLVMVVEVGGGAESRVVLVPIGDSGKLFRRGCWRRMRRRRRGAEMVFTHALSRCVVRSSSQSQAEKIDGEELAQSYLFNSLRLLSGSQKE